MRIGFTIFQGTIVAAIVAIPVMGLIKYSKSKVEPVPAAAERIQEEVIHNDGWTNYIIITDTKTGQQWLYVRKGGGGAVVPMNPVAKEPVP